MFRRIATIVDTEDVLGLIGIVLIAIAAYMVDPRLALFAIGSFFVLLAVARAAPSTPTREE